MATEELKKVPESFIEKAASAVTDAAYVELYGYDITTCSSLVRDNIYRKFLIAHDWNEELALEQLKGVLKWRKEFNPLSAAFKEKHSVDFDKLGVITQTEAGETVTWNLYGQVSNRSELFGRLTEFLRWRIGLMERAIALLDLSSDDPVKHKLSQVHDYMNVSFFRLDKQTRAATSKIIEVFTAQYPEFLDRKFFVNVPYIMGWMYSFMKLILSRKTTDKFFMLANGSELAGYLGKWVPQVEYGGSGESLSVQSITIIEPRDKSLVKESTASAPVINESASAEAETKETGVKEEELANAAKGEVAEVEAREPGNATKDTQETEPANIVEAAPVEPSALNTKET